MAAASNQNIARKWEEYKKRLLESNDREINHLITNNDFLNRQWKPFVLLQMRDEDSQIKNKMENLYMYIDDESPEYRTEYAKLVAQRNALSAKYGQLISMGRPNAREPGMPNNVKEPGMPGGRRRKTYRRKSRRSKSYRRK
jgi:hypothetical protein